jgi:NADPH:quinone reductase
MRAIQISAFGGPLTMVDLPDPVVGAGEKLVELQYAAVNPLDVWVSQGNFAAVTKLPHTGGVEGIGTVNGKTYLVRANGVGIARQGTYAEKVAVTDASLIEVPNGVDPQQAAALGVAGLTAYRCVHTLGTVGPNDVVLVTGASGGVGNLAVQMAKTVGARVIGQTTSQAKAAAISAAGADEVLIATNGEELTSALSNALSGIAPSVIIDGVAGSFVRAIVDAIGIRGKIVNYGTSAGSEISFDMRVLYRKHASILGYGGITDTDTADAFAQLFASVAAGTLRSPIDAVLPLDQAGETHRRILAKEVSGKLLIDVNA